MALSSCQIGFLCVIGILLLARPAYAFGAGNIGSTSKIEGQNWRHGDLEDTLLTIVASRAMGGKKFSKLDVKRVYFGNWLRDYSQAVDVGTVKAVSAKAITILLWILGFMTFGYGSAEFEVTMDRLGCYRPEEHIDNPKDYADNQDARQYDKRLRGPIDERRELSINPETGLKNYIASEGHGIMTSAELVRKLFGRSIQLGRQYARSKNKNDLYEALRLLGTGSHCLEDFAAHSNYVELALIEMGERDIFPHVGRRTQMQLRGARGPVYPCITGTFGGVDFLHSVCGEFDDKVTQSEVQELEGSMLDAQNSQSNGSVLQDLLSKVPSGIFGGKDQAGKVNELQHNAQAHQMQNTRISPRKPEEWARYLDDVRRQILPIIEWHDEIMKSITETIEKIPILPDLIENIQDEVNKFVFSLLAPYVVPIISQVKNELNTGSNEIIENSQRQQHIVFNDDQCSDPTHSMLSKDHFSNILNEPAGKVASQTVKWVVPQLMACWDDERVDVNGTLDRIIHGVLHHPAQRDQGQDGASDGRRLMFQVVEQWWRAKDEREKNDFRDKLSRRGVENGRNHKEGVVDHGHGSMKPLGMANLHSNNSYPAAQAMSAIGDTFNQLTGGQSGSSHGRQSSYGGGQQNDFGKMAGEAVGGGVLGGIVGSIAGAVGGDMLGGGMDENKQTYKRESYGRDGSRTETFTQVGQNYGGDRYGQAQYSRTEYPSGQRQEEFNRYEQRQSGSGWQAEVRHGQRDESGRYQEEARRYESSGNNNSYSSNTYDRREERNEYSGSNNRRQEQTTYNSAGYSRRNEDDQYSTSRYGQQAQTSYGSNGYGEQRNDYDQSESYSRPQQRQEFDDNPASQQKRYSSGRISGRTERQEYASSGYGRQNEDEDSYSRGAYGRQEQSYGGGRERQEESYGGGYGREQTSYNNNPYEQQQDYGRSNDDEYGSSDRYGGESYDDNNRGGYGSGRRDDEDEYGRY